MAAHFGSGARSQPINKEYCILSMSKTEPESLDWALWFYWIMATTLGWLAGSLFFKGIPLIISGVAIAATQWSVLYKRFPKAWRWAVYSSLAWIVAVLLVLLFFPSGAGVLIGPWAGLLVGIAQWTLLRKQFAWAGWWIVISILAWTTGLSLIPGTLSSGTLPGAFTGLTLVLLFRYARPEMMQ